MEITELHEEPDRFLVQFMTKVPENPVSNIRWLW